MGKKVVIVESPAKARTLRKILGSGFAVEPCMGHVRDLPQKEFGVDIEGGFRPEYRVLPDRKRVVEGLAKAVKGAEAVYLAPDPDREGEAIAWHLAEALKLPKSRLKRVTFNEITARGIRAGFERPRAIDMNLVNAQQARRILDRIVGYQLSPLLWKKIAKGLSAGRVQSVALRLIVEREKEIQAFKVEEYWEITAKLARPDDPAGKRAFEAELALLDGEKVSLATGEQARALVERLRGEKFVVASVATERKKVGPMPPFATSQLQQAASVRLGFRPKRTMLLAQQLYEGVEVGPEGSVGLITYMRTDSFRVAGEAQEECRGFIRRELGDEYLSPAPRAFRSRRGAQEAHEAIRPTSVARTPQSLEGFLTPDQLKLYRLIWERFVASQMADAVYDVTRVAVAAGPAEFRASGRVVVFDGHTRVYEPLHGRDEKGEQPLPPLAAGLELRCLDLAPSQHFTKPPPRYTEASLVKTLEKEGIGRPSTYADIISTIQDRGYVEVRDKVFYAKELGIVTNDTLLPFFENIINTRFTADFEEHLDGIEEAKRDWQEVLREFYEPFSADLAKAAAEMPSVKKALATPTGQKCPLCGAEMVTRLSKRGRFMACSGFPKCRYAQPLDENGEPVPAETLEEPCPECGKPLVVRRSRWGRFAGCSGYPKCRYKRRLGAEGEPAPPARAAPEPTGESCPRCGKPLVAREGKRGRFIGCSGYPRCRYTRDAAGEAPAASPGAGPAAGTASAEGAPPSEAPEAKCEKCGAAMVRRTWRGRPFLACSAYPRCRNMRPDKSAPPPPPPKEVGRNCPECQKPLVIRRSRRGEFIGCSGYPKCRYTENA